MNIKKYLYKMQFISANKMYEIVREAKTREWRAGYDV